MQDSIKPYIQFRLRTLLIIVSVFCLCLAALVRPTLLGTSIITWLIRILLASSIALAVVCKEGDRAFWFGFALAGWLDMIDVFCFVPSQIFTMMSEFQPHNVLFYGFPEYWERVLSANSADASFAILKSASSLSSALLAGCFCRWIYKRQK